MHPNKVAELNPRIWIISAEGLLINHSFSWAVLTHRYFKKCNTVYTLKPKNIYLSLSEIECFIWIFLFAAAGSVDVAVVAVILAGANFLIKNSA